jgi:Fic family protein
MPTFSSETERAAQPHVIVPPITFDDREWRPVDSGRYSRRELNRQTGPYKSAVPAVLADWQPEVEGGLGADVDEASRALADFDSFAARTLGSNDPAIAPMSAILLRTESASSSQIENLTTSAKQLALAEIDESEKANAMTVIGNVRAMEAAIRLSRTIDESTVLAMHRELLRHQLGFEEHAGVLRDELVWIGDGNAGPREAQFVAPHHERIEPALADLIRFIERDDVPALVQVAVAHAQFETIHPFVDGNGRTGRALAQAMLRNKGVVSHTTIPLSAGLLVDTQTYFDALTAYRAGNAAPIVSRFAEAALFAAASGRTLVERLAAQLDDSRERMSGVRAHAVAWKALPLLIGQPVVNAKYLKAQLGLNDVTVQRALELLTERGVLVERTGLRRNRVWQHPGILAVLDDFAADIRRAR